ncbi:unannotated protein [freshwater metagenome]|uniref:Unannotated protein n=1 Tax=freshwater metagenome TaxID=449393 RepID=A0A6J7G8Q6_9ZZZZ
MGDDHHRPSFGGKALDDAQYFADQFGVECGGRLVEQHQFGAQGEGSGDSDALLLAAGKLERVLIGLGVETDLVEDCVSVANRVVLGPLLDDHRSLDDVLQHGLVRKQIVALEHHAALRAEVAQSRGVHGLGEVDRHVADADQAGIGSVESIERSQHCGLAGAGRPDDDGDGARRHGERDVLQYFDRSERFLQCGYFQQVCHFATYLSSRTSSLPWKNERIMQITQ